MNAAYHAIINSSDADRAGLFIETAARLGTPAQNVEKDFWVCWTLDALFHGLEAWKSTAAVQGWHILVQGFRPDPSLF